MWRHNDELEDRQDSHVQVTDICSLPGDGGHVSADGRRDLVAGAQHPVRQVLHQLIAELHLLAEGQVVPPPHHGLHHLA